MFVPFSYFWIVSRLLNSSQINTVLDLGCGKGDFAHLFNQSKRYKITGVDAFSPYLTYCQRSGNYDKLVRADLRKKLPFKSKSFDAVVCLQVIEHLKKDRGLQLIREIERLSKKIVVISTPVGECEQEEYDENAYQAHHSNWSPEDFKEFNYLVFGTGLKLVYGTHSHAQEKIDPLKLPWYFLSFSFNPLAYFFPRIAAQMVAVKREDKLKSRRWTK